jgi:ATP adenylyltransferase
MTVPNTNLWAPWRMEYIRGLDCRGPGCFLCAYWARPADDQANLVLWRSANCMAVLNRFPYNSGHVLIAPAAHVGGLEQLSDEQMLEMMRLTRDAQRVIAEAFKAQGFNVGANFGHCAGAGLPDHLHLHVVPRWAGDTNYMSVVGDVRVVPEALDAAYRQLRETGLRMALPAGTRSPGDT